MIDWKIKLAAVILLATVMGIITLFVKKNKITVKYSIIWYLSLFVLIIFSIFPELLGFFTRLVGMQLGSNFLFVLLILFLFFICISLTVIVSEQKEQIRNLVQEISILKHKNNKEWFNENFY